MNTNDVNKGFWEWYSTTIAIPKTYNSGTSESVLIDDGIQISIGYYNEVKKCWCLDDGTEIHNHVIAWMPLPNKYIKQNYDE